MCDFFSFVQELKEDKFFYFDAEQQAALKWDNPENHNPDSHTSIAHFHGYKGKAKASLNKWEYNFLTENLILNSGNESGRAVAEEFCRDLDPKSIVSELRMHAMVHPFRDKHRTHATAEEVALLKKWVSVWASVWDSVGDSVGAYISSFFRLEKWPYIDHPPFLNPFQSCIDLWNNGLVPSHDGTMWRLHGKNGRIVWAGQVEIEKKKEVKT